jgi:predicted alpha/beta hydrolase family esterase
LAGGSDNVILIGHSSGAEAAMRYMEKYKVVGTILVSACWTDLGNDNETISGYYSRPWAWSDIHSNAQWIVQFGSTDDPFIPIEEMRLVAKEIGTEYIEYTKHGHFMTRTFPELMDQFKSKMNHQ